MKTNETEFANQDEEISYKDMWEKLKEDLQSLIRRLNGDYREVEPDGEEARIICAKAGAYQAVLDSMRFREEKK